jgi:histidine triad (HIT) family protein
MIEQDVSCIFCRIVRGEIPATIIEREPGHIVFADNAPQAPTHLLVVPTRHVARISAHDAGSELGMLISAAARIGHRVGPGGFRLIVNEGSDGGQTVDHVHVHILAGRPLGWPPG